MGYTEIWNIIIYYCKYICILLWMNAMSIWQRGRYTVCVCAVCVRNRHANMSYFARTDADAESIWTETVWDRNGTLTFRWATVGWIRVSQCWTANWKFLLDQLTWVEFKFMQTLRQNDKIPIPIPDRNLHLISVRGFQSLSGFYSLFIEIEFCIIFVRRLNVMQKRCWKETEKVCSKSFIIPEFGSIIIGSICHIWFLLISVT